MDEKAKRRKYLNKIAKEGKLFGQKSETREIILTKKLKKGNYLNEKAKERKFLSKNIL